MAEDNTGFSPLDPLGPAYGGINPVTPDLKSLTPFEGETLRDPQINFPEPKHYPILPGINLDNPSQLVRKNVVGSPGVPVKRGSLEEQKKAMNAYISAGIKTSANPNQYAKIYSYNAGPDGNAFYKRYMAYGTEKFDKIGFSPIRDNEAVYNSQTTRMDDFKRMMSHSFVPLFSNGFWSGPKSMVKMLQGDFTSSDIEDARAYEEAAAIGQSSKGGLFGFTNNLMMNFAYTAGIISEAVVEEVGGALLAPLTGGASFFAASANNLRKVNKITNALGASVDGMKAVRQTMSNIDNLQGARSFWQATKNVATGPVGRVFNPLENTFDAISDIRKIKATDNISSLAQISKTAGGLYRDARNINMALSEARLEAGMVENKVYDSLYNQYYEANGKAPTNDEQVRMMKQSKEASFDTLWKNAAIIYASNKITFDNITGPRGGLRNFVKTTADDVMSVGGGKFGNLGKIVYNNAEKKFVFEKNNVLNYLKGWRRDPLSKTLGKTVGYLKGNISEGLQEIAQEVIAGANERYYIDTFNSRGRRASEYMKGLSDYSAKSKDSYYGEELGKQWSGQGFETFASGFFMGTLASPINSAVPLFTHGYNRMFNKDEFEKYKKMKTRVTEGIVADLNNIDINAFLKSKEFSYGTQDILASIKKNGTKKEAMDAEVEALVNATDTMLKTNTTDLFIDKLRTYNNMTDEEFADAMGGITTDEIPKYRQRINGSIERIERIKDRYDYYSDKMPNPINVEELETLDKSTQEYKDRASLYHGWNLAIKNAVLFNEFFEDASKRMTGIQQKFLSNTTLKNTGQREMSLLFRPDMIGEEIDLLTNELNALEGMESKSPAVQKQIQQKRNAINAYKEFFEKQTMFNLFFNRGDFYDIIKERLKKELKRDATQEEIDQAFNEQIGKLDDNAKAEEIASDLRSAFYNYMKNVAASNDDVVFDDNLEKGFLQLLDHYKLGQESRLMVEYINTLHDPGSFFDVARRNQEWMKNLYKNRVKYYEAMVKAEINSVEDNALLNELANRGIYVSLEDFEKWQEDQTPPKEFFDNVNKQVIPYGTDEYAKHYELFVQAEELKKEDTDVSNRVLAKDLKEDLDKLAEEKASELSSLPVQEVVTAPEPVTKPAKAKTVSLAYILENSVDGDYIEITRKVKKELVTEVYYKDSNELKDTDANGEVIDVDNSKIKVVSARKYRVESQPDPAQVEAINTKYQQLEEELISDSPVELNEENEVFIPVDQNTPLMQLDTDLYNSLVLGFQASMRDNPLAEQLVEDPEAYEQAFAEWVKTSPKAKELIDKYNAQNAPAQPAPTEVPTATVEDIERRREEELDKAGLSESKLKNVQIISQKDLIQRNEINAKYDAELAALKGTLSTDAKADIEKELFSETDSKGRKVTVFSTTKEKDGLIKTTFTFNRSDKDPSQRNTTGVPVDKALGDKYTINEEYIPEGARVINVLEIRVSEKGVGATVTLQDSEGNRYQGEVVLNSNTSYNEELAALETVEEQPGIQVATSLSKAAENKLEALGITKQMIDVMSDSEIEEAKTFTSADDAKQMRDTITARLSALGIQVPKITMFTIAKDSLLVAKNDVFYKDKDGKKAIFASALSTVMVTKIDKANKTITLKPLGSEVENVLPINIVNGLFDQKETVVQNAKPKQSLADRIKSVNAKYQMAKVSDPDAAGILREQLDMLREEERMMQLTADNKKTIAESTDLVDTFMDDATKHTDIQNAVESKDVTVDQLDEDLLNDLDC